MFSDETGDKVIHFALPAGDGHAPLLANRRRKSKSILGSALTWTESRRSGPVMHMGTSPCDSGHRLHCLVRSSLGWSDSEIHCVGRAGYALLAERAGYVRVARGAFRSRIPARHC